MALNSKYLQYNNKDVIDLYINPSFRVIFSE